METEVFETQRYKSESDILDIFYECGLYQLMFNGEIVLASKYKKIAIIHAERIIKKYDLEKTEY